MKNKFFRALFPAAVFGLSIMLTAYAANSSNAAEATVSESTTDSETSEASDATDGAAGEKEAAGEQDTSSDEWYSDRDMEQTPDTSEAQTIEVADGQTLSITEEGTYILQGTASDCTVLVNAPEAKVQLILDNVTVRPSMCWMRTSALSRRRRAVRTHSRYPGHLRKIQRTMSRQMP